MRKFLIGIFSFSLLISYCCQACEFEESNPHFMHTIRENGYLFNPTVENERIREEIDQAFNNRGLNKNPTQGITDHTITDVITLIDMNYQGVCKNYAFEEVLKSFFSFYNSSIYYYPSQNFINKYFSITTKPQKGDLVCYYDSYMDNGSASNLGDPVHYGVYDSKNFVKSKWGCEPVYRHPLFYVGKSYGNFIRYYRLKSDVTIETLESERYACPIYTTPLPKEVEQVLEKLQVTSF